MQGPLPSPPRMPRPQRSRILSQGQSSRKYTTDLYHDPELILFSTNPKWPNLCPGDNNTTTNRGPRRNYHLSGSTRERQPNTTPQQSQLHHRLSLRTRQTQAQSPFNARLQCLPRPPYQTRCRHLRLLNRNGHLRTRQSLHHSYLHHERPNKTTPQQNRQEDS